MNACLRLLRLALFLLPMALGATYCLCQEYGPWGGYYGGYPYPMQAPATTVGQSYAMGMSDVVRSKGAYNLMTSEAAINATEAQKNEIQNREQWTNTYFQMRKENKEARAEERGPRPTAEDIVRYAQMGKPKPLGPNQLDAVSGKIYWPLALTTDKFASGRSQLDELFAKRARYGDISMGDLMNIVNITNELTEQLKQEIKNIPTPEYIKAKSFLTSLAYEVQRQSG
jgi:hypothetical protein